MRYLVAQGITSDAKRLITIRMRPIEISFLRGQIMVLKTSRSVIFDLDIGYRKNLQYYLFEDGLRLILL